ncbi:hypothetical protein DL991_11815 [Amycolatopsis sp. WAC 01375]|uniref:hypothetical protein n=1 Tax=unclassified Amycolatopsis TaxID=2618356 RepID=UPI000F7800AF|nr:MULTISPECIES: hypothetical protein [unclassified Amycolatopsis]RSM80269.1 hypothetical protein DL991_11815 [Amycolatopsis sp. WAC 01375]RSN34375.1 hypothetical protein DL990_11920 [Amycolatopsis sp. WAC 01416]
MSRWQEPQAIAELAREITVVRRPNPLTALYHWRYEIGVLLVLPYALFALFQAVGPIWGAVVLFGVANWLFYWRSARRFLRDRLRSVVVQHRLRTGFARARVCTLDGKLPVILWTKPRGDEVEVTVFCPAGVGYERIEQRRALLAAACFASDVHVYRHHKRANVVHLSVCTARLRKDTEDADEVRPGLPPARRYAGQSDGAAIPLPGTFAGIPRAVRR